MGASKRISISFITVAVVVILACGLLFMASGRKAAEKPTLSIVCFQGYAEPAWVEPFEEKYDCEVEVTYIGTVEECFTKTKAAPDEYNIVSNDSGRVKMYYDAGLIQAIDTSKLSNYGKVGEYFRTHPYAEVEPGKKFHVPITWGTQTITINTAKVPADMLRPYLSPDGKTVSLDILIAPEAKGYTAFFDESTNVTQIAAISLGIIPPTQFKGSDWDRVAQRLYEWKQNARTFTTGFDSEFAVLTGEEAYILLGGNDAFLNVELENAGVRQNFTQYPMTEGTICWIDGWVITKPTSGASLDLAHKYIDYMIGDEGQAALAELIGFGIVNPAGKYAYSEAAIDSCWWYGMDVSKVPFPLYVMVPEEDPARRVELWNKVKARP
jgi:putative spermidine/putrescine transport system substrate-binding protein